MTDVTDEGALRTQAPSTLGRRLRYAGPGIVIAVTGVGAGDMVSSLVAGTDFGMVLLWAVVLGAILKYFLTEGIGRWYMASGQTILQGWRSLGRWAIWYFVIYLFIVTFVFGAAVSSTAALAVDAAFPGVLPLWAWAALHSVAAFIVVGIGRYGLFEIIMKTFAALKFGIVILLAILLAPSLGSRPRVRPADTGGRPDQRPRYHRRRWRDLLVGRLHVLGARARLAALGLDPDHAD
ncbi:MAG: Natural resistance-associated macrophage protein [Rubrobacteraceae bacterium]|nr:Natural resistance-associated macrophage protein [Rubrobacteraceae bacterium]